MSAANFRYSLKPDPYSSHEQIAALAAALSAAALARGVLGVVYDIGCAQGLLGQLLPSADFTLYGVDSDPASVELARTTYRAVWLADIEQPPTFHFPEPADVMILADVLEHTREPGGVFDAPVPNFPICRNSDRDFAAQCSASVCSLSLAGRAL